MSTFPLGNNVAVAPPRAYFIGGPALKVLVVGSYSSVVLTVVVPLAKPPAISTLPLGSNVAVAAARAAVIGALGALGGDGAAGGIAALKDVRGNSSTSGVN